MWGNALGWIISVVMVAATAIFVSWLSSVSQTVSARTDFSRNSENASAIALPVSPRTVLASGEPGDAGPIYRRAIEQYRQEPYAYERFIRSAGDSDIETVPAVKNLLEAANLSRANMFAGSPAEIVNYDNEKPALEALRILSICANRVGQLIEKDRPAEAMKLYEAEFSLGEKLYEERLTYAELDAGLTMMAEGATLIGRLDPARAAAAKQFNDARIAYVKQRIQPAQRIIGSADQATLEYYAGDVFYFAMHADDRMWRVEAILKLGRYRYNAGRVGDQRSAMKVLEQLMKDPDPVIRAAATAAGELTPEKYRMLR